jgi:hypothetical protein
MEGVAAHASCGHDQDDENDIALAHVDQMVRKKEVSKSLRDQWKPIRMELMVEPPSDESGEKSWRSVRDRSRRHLGRGE